MHRQRRGHINVFKILNWFKFYSSSGPELGAWRPEFLISSSLPVGSSATVHSVTMGIKWCYFTLFFCLVSAMEDHSPPYYCADMKPQPTVAISQLMGMWYVVEKINHQDERHFVRTVNTCPVVHISEDEPPSTVNPLYNKHRQYAQGHGTGISPNYRNIQEQVNQDRRHRMDYYDRNPLEGKLYDEQWNPNVNKRYLRVFWDEIESIEYHVWYNISKPGFWISRGPENGAALKSQFSHYAGNIQVLKAVGNHMVLMFCHRLPESQLFTIILSRDTQLNPVDIHSIHRMLNRKGLHTNAVEKLCKNGGSRPSIHLSVFSILLFIYKTFK